MLYKLGEDVRAGKPFTPKKYFSIDRVFHNETMDATHLAEFHQVEGFCSRSWIRFRTFERYYS